MSTDDGDLARLLFALVPDALWVFDDEGTTTWANARMAEILGRTPEEMVGLSVFDTLDEEGRGQFRRHLHEMVASGEARHDFDSFFVRPDGTTVWGRVSYVPVIEDGRRTGWLHRITPDTERKELLDALAQREGQLATAQRIAHVGSWSWEVAEDRITWSDELCRIFRVPQGLPVTYADYLERVHPEDRDVARQVIEEAAELGVEYSFDHRAVRPDGEVRWIRSRGIIERGPDGSTIRMSGTAQDITEMRSSEEQAHEATRRLYLLQQMATAANQATSLREALLVAGAGVPEHTRWVAIAAFLYDWDGGPELLDLRGAATTVAPDPRLAEQARASGEVTVGTPSACAETHSLVAMPVRLGRHVVCVVELLADEVAPDEQSHQLLAQIAHALGVVAEREWTAAQLAEARDDAMEASRLKSEFLATMSHEIRTPMNGVIGLTDLLLRTPLDDHQRKLAENLQSAGLTLLAIINDILDLSKIEAGKLELEAADFDVREVLDQVAGVLSGPAHGQGLELVTGCAPDVPGAVRGDSVRFGQVVTNLGSNAVRFTDRGEVAIQVRVEERTPADVVLRVDVTGTGVGIASDARERLFDAFTQADRSTTRRHGGTGLGLAISRQLVEALGGEIWVESELGRGSRFSFTARFDHAANRMILGEQLEHWAMQPVAVPDADEGLATLREAARSGQPFDVAVLDQLLTIRDAMDRDDAHGLLSAAHLVKGSALNLGLPRVARVAQELESLGNAGSTAGSEPLMAELTAEVDVAVEALQRATSDRH
ncbi:ATP-binding protein [Nocardioides pyridinolyticus]